ncbi:hypothetical protein HO173_003924 [Letharia columbiana]|uniref:Centrosomin N-terminal motif 1 domain-containing protein n=1 Tax=Letharia columbiana TaxID=112416 RepID=A0A8H6FZK7_9LECA|nr:uncharacterized protein HO173_003924 [Letharia columbiana]KAF6237723.1 hypothetical protein HO173_003924 [Letharia columbiana]
MATSGANPTSALLQDMLREKKAQTQRVKKTYDPTNGHKNGRDDRDIQSSPIPSMSARDRFDAHSRRGSGVSVRSVTMPKEMGFREMEEHISKINKQNFDLKLEVFHRRQRNEVLESRLEKFQELEANNEELQSINEELLLELEKRDVAIQEAVSLICELEAKNEDLQMAVVKMDFTQSSSTSGPEPVKEGNRLSASPLSTISGMGPSDASLLTDIGLPTDLQVPSEHSLSAPDTLSPPKASSARRVPSFLRETKKSTNVLRSMYSKDGNASFVSVAQTVSLFSGDDDDDYVDRQMTNSPRLSILSESGFSSIYGGRNDQIFGETNNKGEVAEPPLPELPSNHPQRDTQRESRLHKWLDERNMPRTPSPKAKANDNISSIGEVLSEVPNSSHDRNSAETISIVQHPREQRTPEKRQVKQVRSPEKRYASPSFGGPIFGAAVLPPTPDTMSTATLDANSSTPSIITEKSLLDGTPYLAKGYSALVPDIRPQTSDSTSGSASPGSLKDTARQDMRARSDALGISESDTPTRPSLRTYGTETSSGEALSSTQASRTLSYPSPTSRARRLSDQRSPKSYRGSDSNSEKTLNQSPQERLRSGSAATITPIRRTARDDQHSPFFSQNAAAPSPITALPHLAAFPQPQRASSFRSRIASKFSRSISNVSRIPNPSSNPQDSMPSRPPVTRAPASIQHARLPRPASLYGQHPVPVPSPSPTHRLNPMLPEGMLTDLERYSAGSAKHLERRRDRR